MRGAESRYGHHAWRNWGRTFTSDPISVAAPQSEDELAAVILAAREQGRTVKPRGAGHSFTAIASTDGVQVDMRGLAGLRDADVESGLVTIGAGTSMLRLQGLLADAGLAIENLGDIGNQTLGGAIATGTHGTGAAFRSLSGQVRALRMVTADGQAINCSSEYRPELFQAARLGLGALGVITEVTLQAVPQYLLRAVDLRAPLREVTGSFGQINAEHDHVSFQWYPYTNAVSLQTRDRVTDLPPDEIAEALHRARHEVRHNELFQAVNAITDLVPPLTPLLNRATILTQGEHHWVGDPQALWLESRRVRFREMEYAVPIDALEDTLLQLTGMIERRRFMVSYPLRIRTSAAEDAWLSPSPQASAYISLHRTAARDFTSYFQAGEDILRAAGGRPHWGKLHSLTAEDLAPLYPRFGDFLAERDRADPDRVLANAYLERVLGV